MSDELLHPESPYIGKYVCYDQADGGACWGRIKDEAVVNTMHGPKEVFIITDRYVRYWRGTDVKRFRRFFPGFQDGDVSKSIPAELEGDKLQKDGMFLETRKIPGTTMRHRGDTTLRKEMIDLEKDVIDVRDLLDMVDDDTLFKAVLRGKRKGANTGKTAMEIGLQDLMFGDSELADEVKIELRRRLEQQ